MTNICIAFKNLDGVTSDDMRKGKIQTGYAHANVHMLFYIKIDGKFTRNKIYLVEGHTRAPP